MIDLARHLFTRILTSSDFLSQFLASGLVSTSAEFPDCWLFYLIIETSGNFQYTARALPLSLETAKRETWWAEGFQENGTIKVLPEPTFNAETFPLTEQAFFTSSFVFDVCLWLNYVLLALNRQSRENPATRCCSIALTLSLILAELTMLRVPRSSIERWCDVFISDAILNESLFRRFARRRMPEVEVARITSTMLSEDIRFLFVPRIEEKEIQSFVDSQCPDPDVRRGKDDESISSLLALGIGRELYDKPVVLEALAGSEKRSVTHVHTRCPANQDTGFLEVILELIRRHHLAALNPSFTGKVISLLYCSDLQDIHRIYLQHILRAIYDFNSSIGLSKWTHQLLELVSDSILQYVEHCKQNSDSSHCSMGVAKQSNVKEILCFAIYAITGQYGELKDSSDSSTVPSTQGWRKRSIQRGKSSGYTRNPERRTEKSALKLANTIVYALLTIRPEACGDYHLFTQTVTALVTSGDDVVRRGIIDKMVRCFPRSDTRQQILFIRLLSNTVTSWGEDEDLFERFMNRLTKCMASSHVTVALEAVGECNPKEAASRLAKWIIHRKAMYVKVLASLNSPQCASHWHRLVQHKVSLTLDVLREYDCTVSSHDNVSSCVATEREKFFEDKGSSCQNTETLREKPLVQY